jgi:DNA-directed RNA polymerase subunit K/omega
MGLKTIPFRKIEERTEDIFEAVTVIAKRARQIIGDRYIIEEERRREEETLEEISGDTADITPAYQVDHQIDSEAFDATDKPTTMGLEEFLSDELKWDKQSMYEGADLESHKKQD